jgi:hypothetical protein
MNPATCTGPFKRAGAGRGLFANAQVAKQKSINQSLMPHTYKTYR